MRSHTAPWTPGLGQFGKPLCVGAVTQTKSDACSFLHREIAGWKRIGMTETKEQIDVRGPWPDSV
jgi:hypothetical protein